MKAGLHAAAGWIAALAVMTPPQTEPSDCASATEHYKQSVEAVTGALKKYESCVSASNAKDRCAAEIQALEAHHGRYLGYVRVVGRRRAEVQLEEPVIAMSTEYAKKPLLRNKD